MACDARVWVAGRRGRARQRDDVLRRHRHGARRLRRGGGALGARSGPDGCAVPDAPLLRGARGRPRPVVPSGDARAGRADGRGLGEIDRRIACPPPRAGLPPAPRHTDPRCRRGGHARRPDRDAPARHGTQDARRDRARGAGHGPGPARPLVGRAHGRGGAPRGRDDRHLPPSARRGRTAAGTRPDHRPPAPGRRRRRALRRAAIG